MTKIQTIKLSNFKSITDLQADFKGCTAIVTGGNNKGKTSFLRGITDRIRFIRPEVMVKQGEKEGRGEMTLTNGDKFIWEFDNEGKDKLTYLTSEARRSVTKDLGRQFFPPVFDIDKFLQSPPKDQVKQLQVIVGLDFTEIDERYRKAYDIRTERNREAELYHVKLEKMIKVPFVAPVDLSELIGKKDAEKTRLNNLYLENKKKNQETRAKWEKAKEDIDDEVKKFNTLQAVNKNRASEATEAHNRLVFLGLPIEHQELTKAFVDSLNEKVQPVKIAADLYPPEPTYIEEMPDRSTLDAIDEQIVKASEINAEAKKYQEYIDHKKATEQARGAADQADDVVRSIEAERKRMIESVAFPEGITITPTGIEVDGLPLDRNQISTSKLYTAALRIASMGLGEVKTLYFDASFLDKISLAQIEEWASANNLQLLIERPDFDGGDIKYELIETIHEPK